MSGRTRGGGRGRAPRHHTTSDASAAPSPAPPQAPHFTLTGLIDAEDGYEYAQQHALSEEFPPEIDGNTGTYPRQHSEPEVCFACC